MEMQFRKEIVQQASHRFRRIPLFLVQSREREADLCLTIVVRKHLERAIANDAGLGLALDCELIPSARRSDLRESHFFQEGGGLIERIRRCPRLIACDIRVRYSPLPRGSAPSPG
jgi:hypothetical protein